jgi:hypothetical protein
MWLQDKVTLLLFRLKNIGSLSNHKQGKMINEQMWVNYFWESRHLETMKCLKIHVVSEYHININIFITITMTLTCNLSSSVFLKMWLCFQWTWIHVSNIFATFQPIKAILEADGVHWKNSHINTQWIYKFWEMLLGLWIQWMWSLVVISKTLWVWQMVTVLMLNIYEH